MIPIICKACGVELDNEMKVCPLCDTPVAMDRGKENAILTRKERLKPIVQKKRLLQQILWQITSVLLLSGIAATLIINMSIQGAVTWSIYPVSICLIIFSYTTLIALLHVKIVYQVLTGWLISAGVLMTVGEYTNTTWPLQLALPILCTTNIIGLLVNFVLLQIKIKGLNILAIFFTAIAVYCMIIDGIISLYFNGIIKLQWSIIVAACLLPVTAAILFMYFRTRNNKDLQKIFHT